MKIEIENIGVIEKSEIEINGLTVITGKNNSGKSTVGKVLYSVFSSLEDLYTNATKDVCLYAKSRLTRLLRESALSSIVTLSRKRIFEVAENSIWKEPLNAIIDRYPNVSSIDDMLEYVLKVKNDVNLIDKDSIQKLIDSNEVVNKEKLVSISNKLDEIKNELDEEFNQLISFIEEYRDFGKYESLKILRTLLQEFSGQITPIRYKEDSKSKSKILIQTDDEKIEIELIDFGKKIRVLNETVLVDINNIVLFDDSTVIDSMGFAKKDNLLDIDNFSIRHNAFGESIFVESHPHNLLRKLIKSNNIFSEIENHENVNKVNNCISKAFKQDIEFEDDNYICSDDKLNVCNLAMGTKSFLIIKQLLRNGYLNEKTLLILDEPETHLHPEWQNVFAEVIVLLVKELGVKVLLTSHSANFVLAIETYMLKYKIKDITKFYMTQKKDDDYLVNYKLTDADLSKNYADFAKYFSEVKRLRDELKYED